MSIERDHVHRSCVFSAAGQHVGLVMTVFVFFIQWQEEQEEERHTCLNVAASRVGGASFLAKRSAAMQSRAQASLYVSAGCVASRLDEFVLLSSRAHDLCCKTVFH